MSAGFPEQTRQSDWILPMMLAGTTNQGATVGMPAGLVLGSSTTSAFADLASLPGLPVDWPNNDGGAVRPPLGHYVDVTAEAADLYVIFGPNQASVTGANVPLSTAVSTVNGSGVITCVKGTCLYIPAGVTRSFKLPMGQQVATGSQIAGLASGGQPPGANSPCRFVAFVTKTGTGFVRIHQSSI